MVDLRCLYYILNLIYLCFVLLMSGWLKVENFFYNFNFESLILKILFWLRFLVNRNLRFLIVIELVVNMLGFGIVYLNIFFCLFGFIMVLMIFKYFILECKESYYLIMIKYWD